MEVQGLHPLPAGATHTRVVGSREGGSVPGGKAGSAGRVPLPPSRGPRGCASAIHGWVGRHPLGAHSGCINHAAGGPRKRLGAGTNGAWKPARGRCWLQGASLPACALEPLENPALTQACRTGRHRCQACSRLVLYCVKGLSARVRLQPGEPGDSRTGHSSGVAFKWGRTGTGLGRSRFESRTVPRRPTAERRRGGTRCGRRHNRRRLAVPPFVSFSAATSAAVPSPCLMISRSCRFPSRPHHSPSESSAGVRVRPAPPPSLPLVALPRVGGTSSSFELSAPPSRSTHPRTLARRSPALRVRAFPSPTSVASALASRDARRRRNAPSSAQWSRRQPCAFSAGAPGGLGGRL